MSGLTCLDASEACLRRLADTAGAGYMAPLLDALAETRRMIAADETFAEAPYREAVTLFQEEDKHLRFSSGEQVLWRYVCGFLWSVDFPHQADLFRLDKPTRAFIADLLGRVGS